MTIAGLRAGAALALLVALPCAPMLAAQETPPPTASEATRAAQAKAAANLPAEGTRDGAFSTRGFLATRADPVILNAAGKPVWNLDGYAFVTGPAPDTVNPACGGT